MKAVHLLAAGYPALIQIEKQRGIVGNDACLWPSELTSVSHITGQASLTEAELARLFENT